MAPTPQHFADPDALAHALAQRVSSALQRALEVRGRASLVVSGGTSPRLFFEKLRREPLDWSQVCIGLADERWVDAADSGSNEHFVRESLLQEHAAAARFQGLKNGAPTPDIGAVSAWETFARVPRPFDVVVLGMGDDGHTASLFAHSPNLASALNPAAAAGCVAMSAPVAPQSRITLNVSALLDARRIVFLLSGDSKLRTYAAASAEGSIEDMPVRAFLRQTRTPVEVMWAP